MANTLPVQSANSIPYGVALPSPATVTPNAGRVRSGKHSATAARVKHPRDKRRRAREGKRGEEGGNERKRQKMEIVAWEIEDGSVVRAGTVYWMEADLTLGDPSPHLEIRSHHRPQIDKEFIKIFFLCFSRVSKFSHTPTAVITYREKSISHSESKSCEINSGPST